MAWIEVTALSVGLILAASAAAKAVRPSYFVNRVAEYRYVSPGLAKVVGGLAILVEGVLSTFLLADVQRDISLAAAGLLFAIFSGVAWLELRASGTGGGIDCGCLGGVLPLRFGKATVGLNLVVCAACAAGAIALLAGVSESSGLPGVLAWAWGGALAAMFWISQFAAAVLARMKAALDEQGLA